MAETSCNQLANRCRVILSYGKILLIFVCWFAFECERMQSLTVN